MIANVLVAVSIGRKLIPFISCFHFRCRWPSSSFSVVCQRQAMSKSGTAENMAGIDDQRRSSSANVSHCPQCQVRIRPRRKSNDSVSNRVVICYRSKVVFSSGPKAAILNPKSITYVGDIDNVICRSCFVENAYAYV